MMFVSDKDFYYSEDEWNEIMAIRPPTKTVDDDELRNELGSSFDSPRFTSTVGLLPWTFFVYAAEIWCDQRKTENVRRTTCNG